MDDLTVHTAVSALQEHCHTANKRWWIHLVSGDPIEANVGEKLMLIVSELSEGMEGHRKNKMDEHLPHRPSLEVELADALIRIFDLGGGLKMDLAGAVVDKMAYNRVRVDHTHAARLAQGGKAY